MADKGGSMSNAAAVFSKSTTRALNRSNMIMNGGLFKTTSTNKRAKSSLRCTFDNNTNTVTTNIINPKNLQADVVQTSPDDEATTTTTVKPPVEETETNTPIGTTDGYETQESGAPTEESQTTTAPLIAEDSTLTEAPATESETTSTPTGATDEPITELTTESSEESAEIRRKGSVMETTTMPKIDETSTPLIGEMAKGKDEVIEPMVTEEPQKDPYAIDIPLEKKISKHVQRKLWEEIEKRKPLIPKHVALHIQKYAKPPFETRGCKFNGKGSCFTCS